MEHSQSLALGECDVACTTIPTIVARCVTLLEFQIQDLKLNPYFQMVKSSGLGYGSLGFNRVRLTELRAAQLYENPAVPSYSRGT